MTTDRPAHDGKPHARGRCSRWYVRMPVKGGIFILVTFFVLYPDPRLFVRHVSHLRNLDGMVQPDAPQLKTWEAELQRRLLENRGPESAAGGPPGHWARDLPARRVQKEAEKLVYEKVTYQWDWDVWGAADYMPTVAEMFAKAEETGGGQLFEDCDGRAVLAASLMRRLGYESSLVTDLRHVWVKTPAGEWMGPGGGKTVQSTREGNKLDLASIWRNVPVSLSYGIAVFPLSRELVILVTAFVLLLDRRMPWRAAAIGGLLLIQGLLFMRCGALAPDQLRRFNVSWPAVVGLLHLLGGFILLQWTAYRARHTVEQDSRHGTFGPDASRDALQASAGRGAA